MEEHNDQYMVNSLIKHMYFDRILPILPVESTFQTYAEVEADETFLMCRAVIMDVSVSQGINSIIEQTLALMDLILRGDNIISDKLSEDGIQSILILIRLLSDNMEYFWDQTEVTNTKTDVNETSDDVYERQKRLFTGSVVGYSTHRPCFHSVSPLPLRAEIASKLLETCSRIKFNTNSLHILRDMSQHLYGNTSIICANILPAYQHFLKLKNYPSYTTKIDLTVDYVLRFLAASNPTEFSRFIKYSILKPLLENHVSIELGIVQHLDLFGCVYLNRRNITRYLEMVKNLSNSIKKTIYHCLLLYYASKALIFWIMARPKEYADLFRSMKTHPNSNSSNTITSLTSTTSNETLTDLNGSHVSKDEDIPKALSQLVTSLFDDIYSTFNVSSLLTAVSPYNNSSAPQSASSSSSPLQQPQSASAALTTSGPFSPPLSSSIPKSSTPPALPVLASSESSPQQQFTHENLAKTSTLDSSYNSISLDDYSSASKWTSEHRSLPERLQPEVPHMKNIVDLYTTADDAELLSHTSVLRFLTALVVLDVDVFSELNLTSFRNIPDAKKSDDSSTENEDKEKVQGGIKHFTHGLKRLTTLQLSKKKSIKFLTMLIRNLNGSMLVTDVALLDTLKALLTFFTITASVALVDPDIPSVTFSRRLFSSLAFNLDVGKNWESEAKYNPGLQKCLARHPKIHGRSQIEFFAAAIQIEQKEFLSHLPLDDIKVGLNLKKLSLYTEGFRVFFHLPSTRELRRSTAWKTMTFFKTLFYTIPDTLLKAFPYFDDRVTSIVAAILDGSILEEFGGRNLFQSGSRSSPSSILSTSPCQSAVVGSSSSPTGTETYIGGHPILPILSNNSSSSDASSIYTPVNSPEAQVGNLIAPRARRISGTSNAVKRTTLISSPGAPELEKIPQLLRTQVDPSTSVPPVSTISRNIRSPLNQASSRRASDEGFPKMLRPINVGSINENVMSTTSEEYDDARRTMVNIFSIFKRLTNYFILPHVDKFDEQWASTDFKNIIKPIFVAIIDSDNNLQQTAQSFMDVLINYIPGFGEAHTSATLSGYYLLCSYTVTLFSTALFDLKLSNQKREVVLDIIVKFLKVRANLAKISENSNVLEDLFPAENATFPLIAGTVGRALLVSLYSNKSSVQKLLKVAYVEYYQAIKFHEKSVGDMHPPWSENLGFAEAMSRDNYVASGSVAFQRRLRLNILKYMKRADPILFDSMEVIYKKWLILSRTKNLSQEDLADFRSFAGILASMCGVLLAAGDEKSPHLKELKLDVRNAMDFFISKQCQWLNNPDLLTRENSRDILSTELHPLAFKLLFSNLKSRIDDLRSVDLSQASQDLLFVLLEQIIIILRTILRRDDDESILLLFSLDVVSFIDHLVEIVNKIPHDSPKFYKSIIHMSKMFRAIEKAEISLGIAGHFVLKNKWLKLVTNWFNLTIVKDYDFENLSKPHREMDLKRRDTDFLYIDTLIESSKALAFLTQNVPVEVPPSVSEEELRRSKSVVFGNYFNILLKGLEKSTDLEKFPAALKHKISILNENVIISLTNLSNANVDAGLQYSLPMGYSDNKNIRIAFLKVFINIVNNYSTQKNHSDEPKLKATNEILLHLIKHPYFVLKATSVCPANDIDACAAGFVNAFDSRNASHILVSELVAEEIRRASRHMDILRRNSCATRALSLLSRLKGNEYLVRTLNPVLSELIEKGEFFEVEKVQPDNDTQVALFVKYMTKLVDAITNSVSFFPPELFVICQTIYTSVKQKFPDYAYVAAGSFVFLRFFCPALVSPESENIVDISQPQCKRPFITLAKVIQSIANGSDNLGKWTSLDSQAAFLKECSNRIFDFLKEVCRTDRVIKISVNTDPNPIPFEFNFLHRYLYLRELQIRKCILDDFTSFNNFDMLKDTMLMVDKNLGILGQPKVEFRNEIPSFIKDNMEEYPQLYEFMSRHAFRNVEALSRNISFVHESMSPDGFPILTLTFGKFASNKIDIDTVVYRTFQIYARIWSVKHYLVLDCTEFDESEVDVTKLTSLFSSLLPPIAMMNCRGYYYFNVSETFLIRWGKLFEQGNPYVNYKVPHYFVNSYSDQDFVKSLGLSGKSLEVLQDVRVSLHDIALYDERKKRFTPVSLKIGNKYFQVYHETGKQFKIQGWESLVDLKFNDVYEIGNVTSVNVSSTTGVSSEFTVNLEGSKTLIFCSSKYLEIVKMFYYAVDRIEDEYGPGNSASPIGVSIPDISKRESDERRKTICHLFLVILVGLFNEDDTVKNISYNLLATTQDTFGLEFGTHFRLSPEVHVPNDCSPFLCQISKSISKSSPELTAYVGKYMLEGLENHIIPHNYVPQTIICFSYWVPNLYKYVYLMDEEEGPEAISHIVRALIRLTVSDPSFTTIYLQQIWFLLALDGRLATLIVEEVVNHALDRDSENRDWRRSLALLNGMPTVEVASQIITRLMKIIKSFLPSLRLEASTQSWSELTILVKTSIPLFFESPLIAQMYLPETLFIVSLLIDVGPNEIRSSLHELLMNVCHSLTVNDALPESSKVKLDEVSTTFSRQRSKFMFGFSQDKGRILQNFSASSFASKFAALEHFTANIMLLMECSSLSESPQWKTRYKKYLMDAVFNNDSFLSARAMMILGIIGKTSTSEILCRNLLDETMKVIAEPHVTDESLFLSIAHIFTYSKIVEGLDPSLDLMNQMFWLATAFVDSPHPVIFEGGLLFLTNCLNCLYKVHFETNANGPLLTATLMNSREFAKTLLLELEEYSGGRWNEANFSHNVLALISRGLSTPFVKTAAIECLLTLFKNNYREHQIHPQSTHYLCYMFLLYLFQASEQFGRTLKEIGFEEDMMNLDDNNKLPKSLANWLSSNSCCPNLILYQAAVLFNSTISDEPSKLRFALIMRYLIEKKPICVFNFYVVVREELRRISTLDLNSDCVTVSFDIIKQLVRYSEFHDLEKFNNHSLEEIKKRRLLCIVNIEMFDQSPSNTLANLQAHADLIYHRKRLTAMVLSRMTSYI